MKRLVAYFGLTLLIQGAILILEIVVGSTSGTELLVVAVLYVYWPTILLVQKTGNFVGCANMIDPFLVGVPLGIVIYSLIVSLIICAARRMNMT
jgi:hypothetical protein